MPDPFDLPATVHDHAKHRPDAVALRDGDRHLSYADLARAGHRLAAFLQTQGIGSDDRVCILARNRIEFFELWVACSLLDATLVPLNWRLTPDELNPQIRDARAKLLFVDEEFAAVESRLPATCVPVRIGADLGHLRTSASTESSIAGSTDQSRATLQLYTSGTTGAAKGVLITRANVAHYLQATESLAIDETSIVLGVPPLFHVGGINLSVSTLTAGGEYVLLREFDTTVVLDTVENHHITNAFFVPAMIAMLLEHPSVEGRDYTSFRQIIYGAAPINSALLRRALTTFGAEFSQVYGMTETIGAVCYLGPEDHQLGGHREHLLRSAGRPYPWTELRIVDTATGAEAPSGTVGEVQFRTGQGTPGYWSNPDATRGLFTDDHWIRSGDAGYLDEEGYLFLVDRIKDMIVSGGENVYPIDVEEAVAAHPAVREVAVIGVPDERWGEAVKAVVVLRDDATTSEEDLMEFLSTRLPGFKRPKSIDVLSALPRNASGKVLKRQIRDQYWGSDERRIN